MTPIKIFVYGSLKKQCWANDGYLANATFISELKTQDSHWKMLEYLSDLSEEDSFPAIQRGGDGYILGELYEIDRKMLEALDIYESDGASYAREIISLQGGEKAYAYIGLDQPVPEKFPAKNVIFDDVSKTYIWK